MPYKNMPESKWPKMESCVADLKKQGQSGDKVYAICYNSIMGKMTDKIAKRKINKK